MVIGIFKAHNHAGAFLLSLRNVFTFHNTTAYLAYV